MRSCVKAVVASSSLASRQEDGGALRHSPSSSNWQLQRFRKGNGTRCPEHPGPLAFPSKCSGICQECWHLPFFGKRELPEEVCRLITPAPSSLDGDHHESTSLGGQKLRIRGLLVPAGLRQHCAVLLGSSWLGSGGVESTPQK